ncbi:polyprotein [Picornavirus HMU-1]|nr:polyprotein [Picornavirus HMU-1]
MVFFAKECSASIECFISKTRIGKIRFVTKKWFHVEGHDTHEIKEKRNAFTTTNKILIRGDSRKKFEEMHPGKYFQARRQAMSFWRNQKLERGEVVDETPMSNRGASASRATQEDHKTQAATSQSGNVYQINYYGGYGGAHSAAQNNMDPERFTKPITAIMETSGPALKSPSVEEAGYSDRIVQLTSGNSTITTQEAAAAIVGYGVWPHHHAGYGEAIDALSEPGPAVDRFYTLQSVQWTTAWKGYFWKLPGVLTDMGVFGQNCAYHFLMRSGYLCHIQCNTSKFHQGMALVVAVPEMVMYQRDDVPVKDEGELTLPEDLPLEQLTIFPHQLINLRTNNSATLILPYVNCNPAESAITHNNWTLCVIPVVELKFSSGATTYVPVTVSIAPMMSEFSGLRSAVSKQGIPTFNIPGSNQFVTTLCNDGFPVFPYYQETPVADIPGEVNNLMEVCYIDTFAHLQPKNGDIPGKISVEVNASDSAREDQPIVKMDMDLNSLTLEPTYLSRLALFYAHHRGSINLTFMFCGSAMATGKFLIAYTPPGGDAPQSRRDAMLGTHGIWDVGLQSSFTFNVPWISQTPYRFTNVDKNVLGYRGYVTMWYQTNVVVPADTPKTCDIVCLVSASRDFVFRTVTDHAYYQGLEDEITNLVQGLLNKPVTLPATAPAVPAVTLPTEGSIQVGAAPALTAPETGVSSDTTSGTMLATRKLDLTFSTLETSIQNFLSKYAVALDEELTLGSSNKAGFVKQLWFDKSDSTSAALQVKYRMFTYLRCKFDLVIVVAPVGYDGWPQAADISQTPYAFRGTEYADFKVQAMFVPPGCVPPSSDSSKINDPAWYYPTNPSVFGPINGAPVTMRIPYMGLGSAYATKFDGSPDFDTKSEWGTYPGNFIGTVAFRMITPNGNREEGNFAGRYRVLVFARPVDIKVWIPRPIVTKKPGAKVRAGNSRHRRAYVEMIEPMKNTGPRRKRMHMAQRPLYEMPDWVKEQMDTLYCAYNEDLDYGFHIFPISATRALLPYHLYEPDLLFCKYIDDDKFRIDYRSVWHNQEYDMTCIELNQEFFVTQVKITQCFACHCWIACDNGMHSFCQYVMSPTPDFGRKVVQNPEEWHVQDGMWRVDVPIAPGVCGSPLMCKHGIIGMATTSNDETSWFTGVMEVPELQAMQQNAEEQGFSDWMRNVAAEMGASFGDSTMNAVKDKIDDFLSTRENDAVGLGWSWAKSVLTALVKCVCACVMISKAEDKMSAAACMGVMLGVDLLHTSPFQWLEEKVLKLLKEKYDPTMPARYIYNGVRARMLMREATEQGPSDWIREFNAACTAAKGLEWIGQKIEQFVQWIKKLFEKENPRRTKFMKMLQDLPLLMEHIDKIIAARGKYSEESINKVVTCMESLHRGAMMFGVERNFATTQIVQYYKKAMTLKQAMTKGRTEPVAICLHGTPGTGKSLATEIIGRHLSERHGSARPYSLPPDPKHFDGYAQQPVVIMDDLGQNPDGEDMKLFCQMVSSTEFVVPMASLEEKGMPFTSQFVLTSTNCNQLRPPTVAEPRALERRFYLDLDIEVQKDYMVGPYGEKRLDASSALTQCNQNHSVNYKRCCPLICGKAVLFKDRNSSVKYSLDEVVSQLVREDERRRACGDKIDALFQGRDQPEDPKGELPDVRDPEDMWIQTNYDRAPNVLLTIDEQIEQNKRRQTPCPKEIADLLRAVPTEEVIQYVKQQGWIVPPQVTYSRTREFTKLWVERMSTGLSILASLASIAGFIYLLYVVFAKNQGAYSGAPKSELKKPELRRVAKVQGPDMEFINKLFSSSLFDVKTEKGHFSGLGIKDQWLLLPKHAQPDDKLIMDGKEYNILEVVMLENNQGSLELALVKIDRPVKFRDIVKYLPDHFQREGDCMLVINNAHYPRMFCPVGTVTMFGFLNLSMNSTYNTCMYRYPTKSGQCGGVVCKAGKIIAMHIGGDGANGYGAILTKKHFSNAITQGEIVEMKPTTHKPINMNSKTSLHPSVFFDVFPGTKEPAALHPKDKRLEVELEQTVLGKYKGNKGINITENMMVAIDHYVEQIRPLMPENLIEPLSLEEVVYGIEKLDGLDLATSAGYPYVTMGIRKRDLIPERGQPLTKLTAALDLHGYDLPYVSYFKDELRPIEKVKAGKTRLIECSSMNDTIRMKQQFGRLFKVFHENPGVATGSAVGCNPDVDWSKFYAEMGGRPLVAYDYSNFDASMEPAWFECIKIILRKLGYSEEQVRIIDHVNYSTHLFKDKEYRVEGGMPSGCSGTSVFNSINNNLIIRTLVLDVYKGIDLNELKIIAYGDDVIVTYPYQLDAQLLAEAGKEYGLTMTPPDKGSCFNETTWDNVTFLKRRFVPDKDFPFLIHPVFPWAEIYDSIRWTRSAAATQEHVMSLCLLAWHSGEDEYNDFVKRIRSVPIGRMLAIPAYRVLRNEWLDKF